MPSRLRRGIVAIVVVLAFVPLDHQPGSGHATADQPLPGLLMAPAGGSNAPPPWISALPAAPANLQAVVVPNVHAAGAMDAPHQVAIVPNDDTGTAVAQQTATALAQQTATAVAQQTATSVAQQTATANAQQTAIAQQTATANANATASAVPTATSTGTPTTTATATSSSTPTQTGTVTGTPTITSTPTPGTPAVTYYFAEGYTGQSSTNSKATFTEVLNLLNPGSVDAPATITYYFEGGGTPVAVSRIVPANSVLRESVNTDVGNDKMVSATVSSTQKIYASRTIARVTSSNARLDGNGTRGVTAAATTWSFAEGYTGITFQEYLVLFNPSTTSASVTVTLAPQSATSAGSKTFSVSVPAQSRVTTNVRAYYSSSTTPSVGMLVTSTQPVVAERVEYFGDGVGSGKFGSTVTPGMTQSYGQLVVPFGKSGGTTGSGKTTSATGDQEFITLLNPSSSGGTASVTMNFTDASGKLLNTQPVTATVAPGTRRTILANAAVGSGAVGPFSAVIAASGAQIAAEGAQYFGGSPNIGQHPGVVVPALSTGTNDALLTDLSTQLPDGSTGVNRTVYLFNPFNASIQVAGSYIPGVTLGVGPTATPTGTPTGTATPTGTVTGTASPTGTATATVTATGTPTSTTQTPTTGASPTQTTTSTTTATATASATGTATNTATATATGTATATASPTPQSYTVPANGILTINVNSAANFTGALGAEYKIVSGQGFIAYSVGQTTDQLSTTEDYGFPAS